MKSVGKGRLVRPEKKLRRVLGFWQASICGMGIILGAGIYALIGVGAGMAGPALWLGFLIAAVIAGLTGLSYAELSSIFRSDSAEYEYVRKAYGTKSAWVIGVMMIFAALFTSATVAIGFGGYLNRLTGLDVFWSATILILILALVNLKGIKQSVITNAILTFIETAGLLFIIVIGIKHWGSVNLLEMPNGFTGVLQSGALVFFSYIGFQSIVKLTEETKDPEKNIPRAILFSVLLSGLIYVLVAISAVSVVDWRALGASTAPLADVAGSALGGLTFLIIGLVALCSTTNTVLMDIVTCSRQVYGMAKKKAFPKFLSKVHQKTRTPHYAILFVVLIIILMLFIEDIEKLAGLANFFTFLTFAVINYVVIRLRRTYPVLRPFYIKGAIRGVPVLPLLGMLSSLGMIYFVMLGLV